MLEANLEVLKVLSKIRCGFLDALMLALTKLGEEIIVIGVICVLYWCINKKLAYKLGMVFFASGILVQGLKITFHIERPWILDPTFEPIAGSKEAATGYSFPSGHTQGATALYGTFFAASKKTWIKAVCAAAIILVAFSRMYLGVHTPMDVIVSLIVSSVCVVLIGRIAETLERGNSWDIWVCATLAGISIALCIYAFVLAQCGVIDVTQINDCFKSGGAGTAFAIGWYLERRHLNFSVKMDKIWKQIVKVTIGVAITLAIKSGLKLIAEDNIIMDYTRYFATVIWAIYLYPMLFNKFAVQNKKPENQT